MPGITIKVVGKIVQVMEFLAVSSRGVKVKEVQQALALNKGTAFRILRTLESHGLAVRDEDGSFRLGSRILWWGTCFSRNFEVLRIVRPYLEKLRNLTSETVTFSILVGNRTIVVDQVVSRHVTSTRFDLGTSAPLHVGSSGRVLLAHMNPETQKRVLRTNRLERLTDRTITERKTLETVLKECREKGFAISRGERFSNTTSVAAPVFASDGKVLGVISVVGPSERLTPQKCKDMTPLLLKEAQVLTGRIGKAGPGYSRKVSA